MACLVPWLPDGTGSGIAQVSSRRSISDCASSNKHRTPSHLTLAESSRPFLPVVRQQEQRVKATERDLGRTEHAGSNFKRDSPSPIQLAVGASISVASVIYNQEMVRPGIFEQGVYLDTELGNGVGARRDLPAFCAETIGGLEELVESVEVRFWGVVALPPQHEDGHVGVLGRLGFPLRLPLYEHGRILKMAGE